MEYKQDELVLEYIVNHFDNCFELTKEQFEEMVKDARRECSQEDEETK